MTVHFEITDWLIAITLTGYLLGPLLTLLHEFGHALVALRTTDGLVQVHVGRNPPLLSWRGRRLLVCWSPLPPRGVWFEGVCIHAPVRRPSHVFFLAIAGPLGSVLGLVLCLALAWETMDGPAWLCATFLSGALQAFVTMAYNADPRPATAAERAGTEPARRDGPRALIAYRLWRAGDAVPATPRRQPLAVPGSIAPPSRAGRRSGGSQTSTRDVR